MAEEDVDTRSPLLQAFWCTFYGCGIIGALVVYGIIQERIMAVPYSNNEFFNYSVFLVLCNRVVAILFAIVMIAVKKEAILWQAPVWKYAIVSVSNVAATSCQYEALKYISFPVQMLGKSFKMMPVMVWGIAISGKRYGIVDWLVAAVITGGVTMFLLTGSISASHRHGNSNGSIVGLLLLLGFLACDGLTSTMQEKLFKDHKMSKYNQMLYVNAWSSIISLITLLATNQLTKAFGFIHRHPLLLAEAFELSVAACAGQWFIYSQVKEFGALVFAATMNVRQVVSIIISYIKYGHHITGLQIVALFLVFGALFYKSAVGFLGTTSKEKGGKASESEKEPLLSQDAEKGAPAKA